MSGIRRWMTLVGDTLVQHNRRISRLFVLAETQGYEWDVRTEQWSSFRRPDQELLQLREELERVVRESDERGRRLDDLIRRLELHMPNESEPISKDKAKRRIQL